ncbi:uncharacterized protein BDR25DRAFT_349450 [Lindgomyces ingoldianus]|uniref:Uncharacterized protein n=1 Tax=Lindgomyces ingoldianus TaxID=673940 RepID=A0ACB6RB70_9PLEO|nr:uncharacterized protein BDR25DRAFT_349450 [Lindgomyces ingoldianus]KAF2476342.1 hypothetical protein BDR25DRAFT_349450 [Lindgomyces ingoldianus]
MRLHALEALIGQCTPPGFCLKAGAIPHPAGLSVFHPTSFGLCGTASWVITV